MVVGIPEWAVFLLESCLHSVLGVSDDVGPSSSAVWECFSFVEEFEVEACVG